MLHLPTTVAQQLVAVTTEQRSPVLLKVTSEGRLLSWEGALAKYGLTELHPLSPIGQQLSFLDGLFPLAQERDSLPCLQTQEGWVVDIHLFQEAQHSWVLILDASAQVDRITRLQQKGNELNLLRHQYEKLLGQSQPGQALPETEGPSPQSLLSPDQPPLAAHAHFTASPSLTVLLIQGAPGSVSPPGPAEPTPHPPAARPASISPFQSNLPIITQIVVEEGGLINHILGDSAIALFGLLPSQAESAHQAHQAARRLLQKFNPSLDQEASPLSLGLGITTDPTGARSSPAPPIQAPGTDPPLDYSILQALGHSLHRALALQAHLHSQQILIDTPTFSALGPAQTGFTPLPSPSLGSTDRLYQQLLHP